MKSFFFIQWKVSVILIHSYTGKASFIVINNYTQLWYVYSICNSAHYDISHPSIRTPSSLFVQLNGWKHIWSHRRPKGHGLRDFVERFRKLFSVDSLKECKSVFQPIRLFLVVLCKNDAIYLWVKATFWVNCSNRGVRFSGWITAVHCSCWHAASQTSFISAIQIVIADRNALVLN